MASDPLNVAPDAAWSRLNAGVGDVHANHARISTLLRARLGPDAGGLLAEPVLDAAGEVTGWRGTAGALRPAQNNAAHQALIAKATEMAAQMDAQGDAGKAAAAAIRAAVTVPTGSASAYEDPATDKPVLINWGMVAPGQAVPAGAVSAGGMPPSPSPSPSPSSARPVPTSAAAATAASVAASQGGGAAAVNQGQRGGFPWFMWLVPAALAAVLVWIGLQWMDPAPTETVTITPEAPDAYNPSDDLRDRIASLSSALDDVRDVSPEFHAACIAPPEPEPRRIVEAPPEPTPEPTPEPEAQPEPEPEAAPEPEIAVIIPKPTPKPTPPPRKVEPQPEPEPRVALVEPKPAPTPTTPRPATGSACNPTWSPGKQPRMVFVVDGSGSMDEGIRGASSRMSAAKQSIGRVVRSLHPDIRIGMVSFSDCGATSNSKYHSHSERGALLGKVNRINPARRTSLAASIRRAGAMASRRAPTTLVIVSDGEDTCGDNPCAAAREVRRKKPNVTINVIDMSGGSARQVLNCVAQAGGGRVYQPSSAQEMSSQMQRATGQPDASRCQ